MSNRMPKVALVACGGRGSRLDLPPMGCEKSFRFIGGKYALEWTLEGLRRAGVRHLVCFSDRLERAPLIHECAKRAGFQRSQVRIVRDRGLGVHGLPCILPSAIRGPVIFVAGHACSPATTYFTAVKSWRPGAMVVSGHVESEVSEATSRTFLPDNSSVHPTETSEDGRIAVSLPYVLDGTYIEVARRASYQIDEIISTFSGRDCLVTAMDASPIEFDVRDDFIRTESSLLRRQIGRRACA
jgi:hypothetical protein